MIGVFAGNVASTCFASGLLVPDARSDVSTSGVVVVPSMPGFAFSTPVAGDGWTTARVAGTYDMLMNRLGYTEYGAHGSDMGALIARELAVLNPAGFAGAHVLQLFSFPSGDPAEFESFGPKEYAALEFAGWFQSVAGYNQMNATRPQTIAAALSDSPVGQLAYNELFENFGNGIVRMLRRDSRRLEPRKMFRPSRISVSTMPSEKRSERPSVTA